MTNTIRGREISAFFDTFVQAFATFDGKAVGALFVAPGVALKRDGTLQGFSSQGDIEAYYQAALDRYRASGCRSCRYFDLDVQSLGETTAVATASWDLVHTDGSLITRWRQAYFMSSFAGGWRIFGSAYVAG